MTDEPVIRPPMIPLIKQFAVANQRKVSEITGPHRNHDLAMLRRELIKALYLEGYSVSAIARRINRNHTTVLYHLGRLSHKQDRGVPRIERETAAQLPPSH